MDTVHPEVTQLPAATASPSGSPTTGARIPTATYRLQFSSAFGFRAAEVLAGYLHDLGASDIYASPILRARSGSSHGYDVCDPTQFDPRLGSDDDFVRLVTALAAYPIGLLLDTVPNHMGIGDVCNVWWMDVLENGPSSPYATFFDIDWQPIKPELQNKVLLPVLEDQYGAVLESGKLCLALEDGAFVIYYHELKLPVTPGTYRLILTACLAKMDHAEPAPAEGEAPAAALPVIEPGAAPGVVPEDAEVMELQSILTAVSHLPLCTETDRQRVFERYREKEVIKRRLAALYTAGGEVKATLDAILVDFNGRPGDPHSFDLLGELIDAQVFRLAFWRVAGEEINYRRFFDINDLAAVRVEVPEVFQATHQLVLHLLAEGKVSGLRIDHPDGLWDPPTYFRRLQTSYLKQKEEQDEGVEDPEITAEGGLPLYVIAEKILSEREPLPPDWAVYGTTGYDFLASVNNVFVDGKNRSAFDRIYAEFSGRQIGLDELTIACKMLIMRDSLASEINALSHQLERIGERNRHYRDFTLNGITGALREVIACLPVYRTYINALTEEVPDRDRKFVQAAVRTARRRRPGVAHAIFSFIEDTLLLRNFEDFDPADRSALANFVMKFQQITGPVMAKGAEDTAYYIYNRLVSLNEVGSSPDQFGLAVADFHRANERRHARWPHSLLATSTHDNKRSEDVRARINVLSEMPRTWQNALRRWSALNAAARTTVEGQPAPDRNDEYLFYQTLLGTWPVAAGAGDGGGSPVSGIFGRRPRRATVPVSRRANEAQGPFLLSGDAGPEFAVYRQRMVAYMLKAANEAKTHTSWVNPDAEYDQAMQTFIERVLDPERSRRFLADFARLAQPVAYYGQFNSLAQVLLKLAGPGVPDIYQGQELWDFSLVDPDNRRPVDYELRKRLLAGLQERVQAAGRGPLQDLAEELLANAADGRIKLYLTALALAFRRDNEALFAVGSYTPLAVEGDKADHAIAFARDLGDRCAIAVTPRLVVGLTGGSGRPPVGGEVWGGTWLALDGEQAGRTYRNIFTNETLAVSLRDGRPGLPIAAVLAHFPVALLARMENNGDT